MISTDREVSKQLYGIMKDQGSLSVKGLEGNDGVTLVSALKLAGFTGIESANGEIRAKRAQWQASGAPLKRKRVEEPIAAKVEAANPWAAL